MNYLSKITKSPLKRSILKEKNMVVKISTNKKIGYALLEFKDLRDDYWSKLEYVKNYNEEQLRNVLKKYAPIPATTQPDITPL